MRDPYGLVPPHIRANYEAEEMAERHLAAGASLLRALRQYDDQITDVVFFGEKAEPGNGIVPGRWHVKRRNAPPAPDSYFPIETPEGGYREPDSGVLEELRSRDLQNQTVWDRIQKEMAAKLPAALQEKDFKDDGSAEEIAHNVRAAKRVSGEGGMHKRLWGRA